MVMVYIVEFDFDFELIEVAKPTEAHIEHTQTYNILIGSRLKEHL